MKKPKGMWCCSEHGINPYNNDLKYPSCKMYYCKEPKENFSWFPSMEWTKENDGNNITDGTVEIWYDNHIEINGLKRIGFPNQETAKKAVEIIYELTEHPEMINGILSLFKGLKNENS